MINAFLIMCNSLSPAFFCFCKYFFLFWECFHQCFGRSIALSKYNSSYCSQGGSKNNRGFGPRKGAVFYCTRRPYRFWFCRGGVVLESAEDNSCVGDGRDVGVGERVGDWVVWLSWKWSGIYYELVNDTTFFFNSLCTFHDNTIYNVLYSSIIKRLLLS